MDNLTPEQRRHCMSQVKNRDTDLEVQLRSELHRLGLRFRKHMTDLPGRPDIAFTRRRVAVFIDGDFWHGWRFPAWRHRVSAFWQVKIGKNRDRDQRNFQKLRSMGWRVIRIWQHEVEKCFESCVARVLLALGVGPSEVASEARHGATGPRGAAARR